MNCRPLFVLLLISSFQFNLCFSRGRLDSVFCLLPTVVDKGQKGDLRLNLDNMLFMRDNEYKGKLAKGYTLPGYWLAPSLSYQPLSAFRFEAGVYLLHYWGARKYPNINYSDLPEWSDEDHSVGFHCIPIFRVQLQITPSLDIIVGTLYGKSNHNLVEPLFNDEMNYTADPESGVQLRWNTSPLKLDAWVNWECFIFDDDNHQESFTFCISANFFPSRRSARLQWYIPIQTLYQHKGGEVNSGAEDRSVKTWHNVASGVGLDIPLLSKLPTKLNFEVIGVHYKQTSGNALPFDDGFGIYATAAAEIKEFRISSGYWQCHNFISLLGNAHFGAVSIYDDAITYRNPRMITLRAEYEKTLSKGIAWGVHADLFNLLPCYADNSDTMERTRLGSSFSFAFGVCFRVSPTFLLKKFN